jgi:hypothetical protein
MLYGCSKVRLVLKWFHANKFSLVDIACHSTSLYLCWKTFLEARLLSKLSRKGENSFFLQENYGQSYMTISQLLGSTLQVLRTTPVPRPYPPSTPSGTNSIFLKTFYKTKTRHRISMAIPTVHDRGLGYLNRLHSAEVVHFTHKIW